MRSHHLREFVQGSCEAFAVGAAYAQEGGGEAAADGQEDDRGVEHPGGDDEEQAADGALVGDVALVGAGLRAEADGVEGGGEADEQVEDVEVFFGSEGAEEQ